MIIKDLATSGAMPTLGTMLQFAGQRQRIISHNIANIDTPSFQGVDVDPKAFQKLLGDAIEQRRSHNGGASGGLDFKRNRQVQMQGTQLTLTPQTPIPGVLNQSRNQHDLERLMQQLVENAGTYRVAADLMRKGQSQLKLAIAQRVI